MLGMNKVLKIIFTVFCCIALRMIRIDRLPVTVFNVKLIKIMIWNSFKNKHRQYTVISNVSHPLSKYLSPQPEHLPLPWPGVTGGADHEMEHIDPKIAFWIQKSSTYCNLKRKSPFVQTLVTPTGGSTSPHRDQVLQMKLARRWRAYWP